MSRLLYKNVLSKNERKPDEKSFFVLFSIIFINNSFAAADGSGFFDALKGSAPGQYLNILMVRMIYYQRHSDL
jgi:hypothetical protein